MKTSTLALLALLGPAPAFAQTAWTLKAALPSPGRETAVAFSVGGKGYLVGGWNSPSLVYNDTWQYDPATNTWAQLADLPSPTPGRHNAVGLAIGALGYVGTGSDRSNVRQNDWWAFNPALNQWTRKADVPGGIRYHGFGFGLGGRGYVGGGYNGFRELTDFYAYDPATDTWTACAAFPGAARTFVSTFTLNNATGYTVGGYNGFTFLPSAETWAYDPAADRWTARAALPAGRFTMVAWGLNGRGYAGAGLTNSNANPYADYWAYDPLANTWAAIAPLGGGAKGWATGFAINNRGYLLSGTGPNGAAAPSQELWEFTPWPLGTTSTREKAPDCWPNPSSGLVHLSNDKAQLLRVYSASGQLVQTVALRAGASTVDLSGLPPGQYVLKSGTAVRRLSIQR